MISLKDKKLEDLSKSEILNIIIQYCEQEVKNRVKDNLDNEDFNSPSWALKQAANGGAIKFANKLINFIPRPNVN